MNALQENTATDRQVVMYSTNFCSYCDRARALLQRKGIAVVEIKVDEDVAERQAMLNRSGGRRTVPQIFIGDRHVGGYQELAQLERQGELDRLLHG
jgi:glutaredoxin 3